MHKRRTYIKDFHVLRLGRGGGGPRIKFGGKIWGKAQQTL